MKRFSCFAVAVILMVTLYRMIPHYEILAQYSFSSPGSRETTILAVSHTVGPALYASGETILRLHRKLNYDVPSSRVILMIYGKKSDVEKGKCSVIMIYEGEDGSREEDAGIVLIK